MSIFISTVDYSANVFIKRLSALNQVVFFSLTSPVPGNKTNIVANICNFFICEINQLTTEELWCVQAELSLLTLVETHAVKHSKWT